MAVRVAVHDPLPLFRQGVMAALGDLGYEPEAPDDVLSWARRPDRRVVLFTVHTAADWALLAELCRADDELAVVAMLDRAGVAEYLRAISAGVAGAVPRQSTAAEVRAAFQAAVQGNTLLPVEVLRALAGHPVAEAGAVPAEQPTTREIGWLRDLAQGVSVSRLADRSGYSERMMFRLLRELYTRLGVANRTEALILARDRSWI